MSAKCSPYMYGAPYIFYFVHPIVKTVEMMVQRVNFEQNLKNIRPATVSVTHLCRFMELLSPTAVLGRREGRQQISNISQGCHICVIMSSLPVLNRTEFFTNLPLETHISILFSYLPQCSVISKTKQRTGNLNGRVWQPLSKPFLQEVAKMRHRF